MALMQTLSIRRHLFIPAMVVYGSLAGVGALARGAHTAEVATVREVIGSGKEARITWISPAREAIPNPPEPPSNIFTFDSRTGQKRQITTDAMFPGNPNRTLSYTTFTWDGSRIVFYMKDNATVYVMNWDGTGLRTIVTGFWSSDTWRSPADKSDWVICAAKKPDSLGPVYRINIDRPAERVLLWDKSPVGAVRYENWASLSPDGKVMTATFPWPRKGVVSVPNGTDMTALGGGCWPSMTRDNTYDVMHINDHRTFTISNRQGVKTFDKSFGTVFGTSNYWFSYLRWCNDRSIVTFSKMSTSGPFLGSITAGMYTRLHNGGGYANSFISSGTVLEVAPRFPEIGNHIVPLNQPFDMVINVSGEPLPTLTASGLPPGLTLRDGTVPASTFHVAGQANTRGDFTVTLTARNSKGSATASFTLTVTDRNAPPVVQAGPDVTTKAGLTDFLLQGTATDDGVPQPLVVTWRQVSGPAASGIASPSTATTIVTFAKEGTYQFELSAFDGTARVSDTVKVTVAAALPFVVLYPRAGDTLYTGSTVELSWQMDPPEGVLIEFSSDNGRTWQSVTETNAVGYDGTTKWNWRVSAALQPSGSCRIRVVDYNNQTSMALSEQFAVLKGSAGVNSDRAGSPSAGFLRAGMSRIPLPETASGYSVSVFDMQGHLVARACGRNESDLQSEVSRGMASLISGTYVVAVRSGSGGGGPQQVSHFGPPRGRTSVSSLRKQ